MILSAVACAAVAAALLTRPPTRLRSGSAGGAPPGRASLVVLSCGPVAVAAVVAPRLGLLLLVLGGALVAAGALWRRRVARRAATVVSAQVLETCELLAAELASGQPPGQCLDRAASAWPPLGPVAEAFRVGADVPTALRELADGLAGARDLRIVAAAWQVAHRTGAGLAVTVDRVAESLRAAGATRRLVAGELASARATARLVAGLPVLALAMGSGAGGDPWGFLFGTPAGLACLAGGLAFGFAGLWWIEALARSAEESA